MSLRMSCETQSSNQNRRIKGLSRDQPSEDLSSGPIFECILPSGFFRVVPQYGKKESLQPLPDRDADDWCQVNVKWEHP